MEDNILKMLKKKHRDVLKGNEKAQIISYKNHFWEGIVGKKGNIYAKRITGIRHPDLTIKRKEVKVIIKSRAYSLLIKNTRSGYIESVGSILGFKKGSNYFVSSIINFTKKVLKLNDAVKCISKKFLVAAGGGSDGTLASPE